MFYMEVKVENLQIFSWRKVEETVQLAFEEHSYISSNNEDAQTKNHDIHNLKKIEPEDAALDPEVHYNHVDGSKEIFNGQERLNDEHRLAAYLDGQFEMDLANKTHMVIERSLIPTINVRLSQAEIKLFEEAAGGKDWKLVVEVMFGEKSHSSNCQKYKIFKGGMGGLSRRKYTKSDVIEFKNLKVNYHTTVDKNSKIIILLYYLTEGKKAIFRQVLISKDLFIIQENKLINVDTEEALKQYFDLFGSEFMDKLPAPYKVNKNDKYNFNEEITKLEQYMLKKNKRFLNVIFLSFKFPHFCQLYFWVPDHINEEEAPNQASQLKKTALSNCLTEAINQLEDLKIDNDTRPQLLCNYLNPAAKLIFRININLRKVRIFIRKQFTEMLSIIASEDFKEPAGFAKLHSARQLKQFYLQYYSYARKCKTSEGFTKPANFGSSGFLSNPADQHLAAAGIPKKQIRRPEDDQYHDEDLEEEQQSENQEVSHEGYSGDKKNKKLSNLIKKQIVTKKPPGNLSPKQNKYPTRGKSKAQEQDSDNNESKKNSLTKKIKDKQAQKKPQNMGGMINPLNPMVPMPFQMIPPGGQTPITGMFPMMQTAQKKEGPQGMGGNVQKGPTIQMGIQGIPGMGMAGMAGMPGGISFGGMPQGYYGLPAGMTQGGYAGMPFGMMNPGVQQQTGKKQNAKDGKQDGSGSSQAPKQCVQMMMPMQMAQGMGMGMGMQMPMMAGMGSPVCISPGQMTPGMPQGFMGMQGQGMQGMMPMAIQGPNGQTIMVMSMTPQQMQQLQMHQMQQTNSQQNTQQSSNTSTTTTSASQPQNQGNMIGGMPMSMMIPGPQGMQGITGMQGIPGMQGMMMPQGIMIGANGQQFGMLGGNNQPANNQGGNPMQGLNLGQFSGLGGSGLPMGFVMPSQPNAYQGLADQKTNADKNANSQANPKLPEAKKNQSNKKQEKTEFPPPLASANETGQTQKQPNNTGLPSFLTANSNQAGFPPMLNSNTPYPASNQQKQGQKPKTNPQTGFPPGMMIGMPGGGAGGMMLTPEMLQQLGQGGQGMQGIPQIMLPQGMSGLPQGITAIPQGMGMPPVMSNLPPGVGFLTPEMLNSMPPQQRQMIMQQMQQMQQMQGMGKMPMGFPGLGGQFMKKDEQKK